MSSAIERVVGGHGRNQDSSSPTEALMMSDAPKVTPAFSGYMSG